VGTLATPGVIARTVGREREKTRKLWIMVKTWTNWNLTKELLGMSNLQEGVVLAVGQ
jgi:hypothetical protein